MEETKINKLKEAIINQAKHLLEEFSEFYSFGFAIDLNNNIKPIDVYYGEDHPTTIEDLEQLEIAFKERIKEGDLIVISICVDVPAVARVPRVTTMVQASGRF